MTCNLPDYMRPTLGSINFFKTFSINIRPCWGRLILKIIFSYHKYVYFRVQARILYLLMIENMLVIAVFKPVPFNQTFLLSAYLIIEAYYHFATAPNLALAKSARSAFSAVFSFSRIAVVTFASWLPSRFMAVRNSRVKWA
jgi:hypothetical protein